MSSLRMYVNNFRLMILLQTLLVILHASGVLYYISNLTIFYYLGYIFVGWNDFNSISPFAYALIDGHNNVVLLYLGLLLVLSSHNEFIRSKRTNLYGILLMVVAVLPFIYSYFWYFLLVDGPENNTTVASFSALFSGLNLISMVLLVIVGFLLPKRTAYQQEARKRGSWGFLIMIIAQFVFILIFAIIFPFTVIDNVNTDSESIAAISSIFNLVSFMLISAVYIYVFLGFERVYYEPDRYEGDFLAYPKGAEIYGTA